MVQELTLTFTGRLAPDSKITARTLSHSLMHLQRAVDKVVIFETRGAVRKYSQLPSDQYELADLIVQPFIEGSIKIPLLNTMRDSLVGTLRSFLHEPYQIAAAEQVDAYLRPFDEQVTILRDQLANNLVRRITQGDLIEQIELREREYVEAAILQDLNNLVSPLRSTVITENETITLGTNDGINAIPYQFNKQTSTLFNKIVRSKKLGDPAIYEGILEGLEKVKLGAFPYAGKFLSKTTNQEMKLLIPGEEAAQVLNKYNISGEALMLWGAPLTVYGAFDEVRGDIVFLDFVK